MKQFPTADLDAVMTARENRASHIAELIETYRSPVVCLTMNMIGDVKTDPLSRAVFVCVARDLNLTLKPTYHCINLASTGDEAYYILDGSAYSAKRQTVRFEETAEVGRTLDIDVIDVSGDKLSREIPRRCLVCSEPAKVCARSRAHGVDAIRNAAHGIFKRYLADKIAAMAYESLLCEVDATPKPGLVDRLTSGAHSDMDISTFYRSAAVLRGYFFNIAQTVFEHSDESSDFLMPSLQKLGLTAEKSMLYATGGVNTHKGAIYSLGLLAAAVAHAITQGEDAEHITKLASRLANSAHIPADVTHGTEVAERYGAKGARGEACNGFPTALNAKTRYESYIAATLDRNTAAVFTLADIAAITDDTNVLHRTGRDGLRYMQSALASVNELPANDRMFALTNLDADFIAHNISPGGCADMLAAAIFLSKANQFFTE